MLELEVIPVAANVVPNLLKVPESEGIVRTPEPPLPEVLAVMLLNVCKNWAMAVGPGSVGSVAPETRLTGVTVVEPSADGCKAEVVPSVMPAAAKVTASPEAYWNCPWALVVQGALAAHPPDPELVK